MAPLCWAYLESDFLYAAHRTACAEGGIGGGRDENIGTLFPLALAFVPATSACDAAAAMGPLAVWLRSVPRPFGSQVRVLLVLVGGARPASLRDEAAAALAICLVGHGVGAVEVRDAEDAARYVVQCAAGVSECRRRRVPSRFKVAGVRCQTLPRDPREKLRHTWVSQLMQVAGVSEEIAKAIAGRYPTPWAFMEAVARAAPAAEGPSPRAPSGAVPDAFLADLEYPIRGKKGTRRLGPVVSRRLFSLFHPSTPADHVLV